MLSSDVDLTNTTPPQAATYLTTGHRTALNRYIGFDHTQDPLVIRRSEWIGPRSDPLPSVQRFLWTPATPTHTHQRITSAAVPNVILATHDSTAVDSATPMGANGTAEFGSRVEVHDLRRPVPCP